MVAAGNLVSNPVGLSSRKIKVNMTVAVEKEGFGLFVETALSQAPQLFSQPTQPPQASLVEASANRDLVDSVLVTSSSSNLAVPTSAQLLEPLVKISFDNTNSLLFLLSTLIQGEEGPNKVEIIPFPPAVVEAADLLVGKGIVGGHDILLLLLFINYLSSPELSEPLKKELNELYNTVDSESSSVEILAQGTFENAETDVKLHILLCDEFQEMLNAVKEKTANFTFGGIENNEDRAKKHFALSSIGTSYTAAAALT